MSALLIVSLALLGLVALTASGAARSDVVTIDRFGLWTLQDLGYGDEVRYGTDADLSRPPIYFGLPGNATQGPDDCTSSGCTCA